MDLTFTVQGAHVLYRGVYLPREAAEKLLALFRKDAAQPDYFQSDAKRLADELARAMDEADHERKVA